MSQNEKNKPLNGTLLTSKNVFVFKSEVVLFLVYLLIRIAPFVAVVFYFTNVFWTLLAGLLSLLLIIWAARSNNHRFLSYPDVLQIEPSFWSRNPPTCYPYTSIQQAIIKLSTTQDKRQWLALQDETGCWKRFRCDWLHQQDPPSIDEHEDVTPQHELFELLDEENFYQGSIQQLAQQLQQKGVVVHITYA